MGLDKPSHLHSPKKGYPLGSLVCDYLLCFCHFPLWCPGSGVVLDCIDFRSLPPYLLSFLTQEDIFPHS